MLIYSFLKLMLYRCAPGNVGRCRAEVGSLSRGTSSSATSSSVASTHILVIDAQEAQQSVGSGGA